MVHVVFTVYQGFVAWVTQTTIERYAPPEDAEVFLSRCLSFSLRRGLLAYGGLLVPLVMFPTLWSQKRSIRRQAAALSESDRQHWPPLNEYVPTDAAVERPDGQTSWSAAVALTFAVLIFLSTLVRIGSAFALKETDAVVLMTVFGVIGCVVWGALGSSLPLKK